MGKVFKYKHIYSVGGVNIIQKQTAEVGTLTEPECLAPCDTGTEVHLSGIIWHESDSGKLPFSNGGQYLSHYEYVPRGITPLYLILNLDG